MKIGLISHSRTPTSGAKSAAARRGGTAMATILFSLLTLVAFIAFFTPLPPLSLSSSHSRHRLKHQHHARKFEIADDKFWKDGEFFQILGGDLHYFRVLPELWEDRLMRAKALGLNTIQTYVPWNLHEPSPGKFAFEGIADLTSFLRLCQKLGFLVMLRAGPYICGEWDLGGFPPWLLEMEPALKLRSSEPSYLQLVEKWWGILLPLMVPLLYCNGGSIIMVQIENEYGSYGDDKAYMHFLVKLARRHLGDDIILYTTDGGSKSNLENGTVFKDDVYSAVDFTTGDAPWPIFVLQKKFNIPGKSPPLSSEFYTGWLTHWGEMVASTDADFTAAELEKILSRNGSAVLYMAHGGTNFGFYNGANTGANEFDYKPDLTSYDYDAPIKESGDVDNPKFRALRGVLERYNAASLPPVPPNPEKGKYGDILLQKMMSLFDGIEHIADAVASSKPMPMESVGQMYGFLLYVSQYAAKDEGSNLFIPKVHDRAQVFVSCSSGKGQRPTYAGTIERWSKTEILLPSIPCASNISLYILVENMGRINYGPHIFDRKGILSPVYLDKKILQSWKMYQMPLNNLNDGQGNNSIIQYLALGNPLVSLSTGNNSREPAFFKGQFTISEANQVKDTFLSLDGWGKGIALINNFNLGRYWPSLGPQCNLYIPGPVLHHGQNTLVLFELESPNPEHIVRLVDHSDFTCRKNTLNVHSS
ncbi:Beta-galactosidase 17 [Dionaea muscipula]